MQPHRWFGVGFAQGIDPGAGARAAGEPMLVTASADNRVYTLDDRPALDLYLERLGIDKRGLRGFHNQTFVVLPVG